MGRYPLDKTAQNKQNPRYCANHMRVHIRNAKGNKDRFVPLPENTLHILKNFWLVHKHPLFIFPNRRTSIAMLGIHRSKYASCRCCRPSLKMATWWLNEIQTPRRKNVIIAYDRLRELAGFKDYESFATAHRKWIHDSLEKTDAKRDRRWTKSIAVGSIQFTERIKNAMGAMARGRSIRGINAGFELRESQSAYNAIFNHENCDIAPK